MSAISPLNKTGKTDWNKCCLCQVNKGEDLKSPPTHYSCRQDNDGYSMISANLPLFQAIKQLPIVLDPSRLDQEGGIEETLRRKNAKYHQSCRLLFSNSKLKRARKGTANMKYDNEEGRTKLPRTGLKEQH